MKVDIFARRESFEEDSRCLVRRWVRASMGYADLQYLGNCQKEKESAVYLVHDL